MTFGALELVCELTPSCSGVIKQALTEAVAKIPVYVREDTLKKLAPLASDFLQAVDILFDLIDPW